MKYVVINPFDLNDSFEIEAETDMDAAFKALEELGIGEENMIKPCTKCGMTFRRAPLSAMLIDAGAKVSPKPEECPAGGYHNFQWITETPTNTKVSAGQPVPQE